MRSPVFIAIFLSMIGTAEAQDYHVGDIFISQPWARVAQGSANEAAVYMTLFNLGAAGDRLISASSPVAERSELHLQWHPDHDPAIQAIPIPPGAPAIMSAGIEVTPGQPTVLAPGGMHLMLIGLRQPLRQTPLFPPVAHLRTRGHGGSPVHRRRARPSSQPDRPLIGRRPEV